jgi:hypothetical protein
MELYVKSLKGQTIPIDVEPSDTIEMIKFMLEEILETPWYQIRFIFAGKELENGRSL